MIHPLIDWMLNGTEDVEDDVQKWMLSKVDQYCVLPVVCFCFPCVISAELQFGFEVVSIDKSSDGPFNRVRFLSMGIARLLGFFNAVLTIPLVCNDTQKQQS